jgi:phage tail sheath gpL-like
MSSTTYADTPVLASISFDEIPHTKRTPGVHMEFNSENAQQGATIQPFTNLVAAQRKSIGLMPALQPVRYTRPEQVAVAFGEGSMIHEMAKTHFKGNPITETWFIALDDDPAGQQASGAFKFGGALAKAGTLFPMIGDERIKVGVDADDTLADIAAKVVTAVNAQSATMVTAAVDGVDDTKVNLTAVHKGEVFNSLELSINYFDGEELPEGLTVEITPMSGGTANPDLVDIWTILGEQQFNVIAQPYTDAANLTALEAELDSRFNAMRANEGVCCTAANMNHSALGALGDSRNNKHISIMACYKSPSPTFKWAAAVAAMTSLHGNIDPARPFQTLALYGILPAPIEYRFIDAENNLLLFDGISTHTVDSGGLCRIQRLITTYKTSPAGATDTAYLDVNTLLTLSYIRFDFRNYIARKYPRHKLASDGNNFGRGQAVMTPKLGRSEAIARFRVWERNGLVEGISQFERDLICVVNPDNPNRLDWRIAPNLVNQFRIGASQCAFIL